MGLATEQARFLCITARKADCEYKSTEIAQQKLEITNQLSNVSADYSNALNSTKLIWQNDATDRTANVTYSLLMTPSAYNDYNPYFVTTASGAIVLNSEYAAAAKAAGISKAGGIGSSSSRDKFIQELVGQGIVTDNTAKEIINTPKTNWNPSAGMGATPMDKAETSAMQLSDLILSDAIGKQKIDWTALYVDSANGEISETEYNKHLSDLKDNLITARQTVLYDNDGNVRTEDTSDTAQTTYAEKIQQYETDIKNAKTEGRENDYNRLLAEKKQYIADNPVKAATYDIAAYKAKYPKATKVKGFDTIKNKFQTSETKVASTTLSKVNNKSIVSSGITVVKNGIINSNSSDIRDMDIGDILSGDVTLMIRNNDKAASAEAMANLGQNLLLAIAKVLGYGQDTGIGLNIDEPSRKALEYAYTMVSNTYLRPGNTIANAGRDSDSGMTDNSAYANATNNNRIGQNSDGTYTALSLSNMLSSFLTYYDNALNGTNSKYVVGKSVETSNFVTDDSGYYYIGKESGTSASQIERLADFFDEIYNNICEKGWREDSSIDDEEYMTSAIKDGRYAMASLNNDGYYYQTRYNETGYMEEVTDDDAIARAEAEFTRMKSELTYKEDSIDLKSKKLDAEISALSTEYDTVKNLISKSIEKTFTMFSS